jgi:hypothetical protein
MSMDEFCNKENVSLLEDSLTAQLLSACEWLQQ